MSSPIIEALHRAGITQAFGLPGHQNIDIFEALRTSKLRTVVPTHELAAAFMANGYNRASGEIALLTTIPGPGFTYALTGLAEAWLDSAGVVVLTPYPACEPGSAFQLQVIDQATMAAPVVKAVLNVGRDGDGTALVRRSVALARDGEPGPVLLQSGCQSSSSESLESAANNKAIFEEIADLIAKSRRVVLLVGQGAAGAAADLVQLAEKIGAAVVTTTSGRGVLPEDHRLSLGFEMSGVLAGPMNDLVGASDLVVALGCKFSHNGSRGFDLSIPQEKLVQVDASATVIGANYPVRIGVVARCEDAVPALAELVEAGEGWSNAELTGWRERGLADSWPQEPEPRFSGRLPASGLVAALRDVLPRDAIVVTDSGRHQMMVRRWFRVLAPRGLIVPSNLQSMGFAIPAAIGASLVAPHRRVLAVLGDGGFMMSGLELVTAVREGIQLTALVVNDGAFGLIRTAQLAEYGAAPGSKLVPPDLAKFADTIGANYVCIDGSDPTGRLAAAMALPGVTLVEAPVREATAMTAVAARGLVRRRLRRTSK